MVGAGVVAGDDVFDDFEPRPFFATPVAGLAAVFVAAVRLVCVLRVVFAAGFFEVSSAFCCSAFAFSRASYSCFEGIFRVTRFKPEVRESISSFSLPLASTALLVYADGTRGTGGR